MNIFLNGKTIDLPNDLTIAELLTQRSLDSAPVIIEHNYNLVKKGNWNDIVLKENDRLEILRLVEGG